MKATVKDNHMKIEVREMTEDEIDTSDGRWFCDDSTYVIYAEHELELEEV